MAESRLGEFANDSPWHASDPRESRCGGRVVELEWLRDELARMNASMGDLTKAQLEIQRDLAQHILRTKQNETMIEKLERSQQALVDRLKPILDREVLYRLAWKWLLGLGALAAAALAIYKLMEII